MPTYFMKYCCLSRENCEIGMIMIENLTVLHKFSTIHVIFSARTCSSAAVGVNKLCSETGACERKHIEDTATADACLELCRQQPLCLNWVGVPANKFKFKTVFYYIQ